MIINSDATEEASSVELGIASTTPKIPKIRDLDFLQRLAFEVGVAAGISQAWPAWLVLDLSLPSQFQTFDCPLSKGNLS